MTYAFLSNFNFRGIINTLCYRCVITERDSRRFVKDKGCQMKKCAAYCSQLFEIIKKYT